LAWFRYRETVGCLILREHSRGPATTLYSNPLSIVLPYVGAFGLGKFSVGLFAASEAGERVAPSDGGARSLWARLRALIDSTAGPGKPPAIGPVLLALLAFLACFDAQTARCIVPARAWRARCGRGLRP